MLRSTPPAQLNSQKHAMQPLLLDTIAHFARVSPHKLAVHDLAAGETFTYAQLDDAVDRAAWVLRSVLTVP
jgi:acyl-CoA synthetase (AMP-forming)/AMP-acid ligase II